LKSRTTPVTVIVAGGDGDPPDSGEAAERDALPVQARKEL
jgi:hypothetical protein